jgi:hypothetical protein
MLNGKGWLPRGVRLRVWAHEWPLKPARTGLKEKVSPILGGENRLRPNEYLPLQLLKT